MALDITNNGIGVVAGVTGGIEATPATGNVTVEAGVKVDGSLIPTLGAVLGGLTGIGDGILATSPTVTITNNGAIVGTGSLLPALGGGAASGIVLTAGGSVDNALGASITGANDGIMAAVGLGGVVNAGTVTGNAGVGVALATGTLVNQASGTITGALDGVLGTSGPVTLTNLGTISASAANGVGVSLLGGSTLIDAGTISGAGASGQPGGVAVSFGSAGGSRLVLDPGHLLQGSVAAGGTGNTLELAAGMGVNTLADIGTTLTGFGNTVVDAGTAANVTGSITTPGTVTLDDGASLTVGGPVAAGVSVDLGGAGATLTLAAPTNFAGTIADLGSDDTLDLQGLGAGATVTYDPTKGSLVVTTGAGSTSLIPVTLAASLNVAGLAVTTSSDGAGGLDVSVGPGTGTGVTVGTGTGTGVTVGTGTGTTTGTGTGTGSTTGTGTGIVPGTGTGTGSTTGTGTGIVPGTGTGIGGVTGTGTGIIPGTGTGTGGLTGTGTGTGMVPGTVTGLTPQGLPIGNASQVLPLGSSMAAGTGAAQGDMISIDPGASFDGKGQFTITGHASSLAGVASVAISAVVDGGAQVTLGAAAVAADGSFSFQDAVGAHLQGFITATETDGSGGTTNVQAPYSLQAGFRGASYVAQEELYSADGSVDKAVTSFHKDGSSTVDVKAAGQVFQSNFFDTYLNGGAPENTFVFNPGHGLDVISLFRFDGADHDTISLPSADFAGLADVLRATHDTAGGAVIHDPTSGDTIRLAGVSKAELKANPSDFKFHA